MRPILIPPFLLGSFRVCRWILKNLGDDLTEEDIDDMIADVDTDGSGWVDYDGRLGSTHVPVSLHGYSLHEIIKVVFRFLQGMTLVHSL